MTTASQTLTLKSLAPMFTVNDLEASIKWYCDILGFTIGEEWRGDDGTLRGASLNAGDANIGLAQDDFAKGRNRPKGVGFRIYCTTNQDVDALAAAIKSRGGTLDAEPATQPWGARVFSVADPDGFKISVATEGQGD